jgi:3-deoxy-manno-octulosonate cytidylyltransferase (CMP-KDO synthetase)
VDAVGVIPARYGSTRFPGKPLADLLGKPLLQHVWEGARQSRLLSRVIIATDDERIYEVAQSFGGEVVMTGGEHPSGTDRVAEVVREMDVDVVVNVQGDEPLIEGRVVDDLVSAFEADETLEMATLVNRVPLDAANNDPHTAKVVTDRDGFALYFSRWPIPFVMNTPLSPEGAECLQHVGMYGFRKGFLMHFTSLDPTPLEQIEGLEQLRALEHGFRVKVIETDHSPANVDTPDDLERVRAILKNRGPREEVTCAG